MNAQNNKKEIYIVKRNGQKEPLDINKVHKMTEAACNGLTGVSPSLVEMNSGLQFSDNMTTKQIQEILIRSANDLITLEAPNYQYVAARLLLFTIRKEVFGKHIDGNYQVPLQFLVGRNVEKGLYDPNIMKWYNDDEFKRLDSYIKHERDYNFTYAGLRQVSDKYLVQDRSSGNVYETPQYMYMLIAATLFCNYPKETRLSYVCLLYTSPSPRDQRGSRMPSSG